MPFVLLTTLIVALGGYTALRQDAFLGSYNLRNLLLLTMPLALVSLGQTSALLVGGFDVSVGALMTVSVVIASYTMTPTNVDPGADPGRSPDRRRRLVVGVGNAILNPRLPSPLDHCHTRHVQHPRGCGAAAARPSRGIDLERRHRQPDDECRLRAGRLHRSRRPRRARRRLALPHATGLAFRAVGLDETASRRIGMGTTAR